METKYISFGHFFKFPILSYTNKYTHTHNYKKNNEYKHYSNDNWHVMNKPTNEAWIDPWIKYLKSKGLKIFLNSELIKINTYNGNIISVDINQNDNKMVLKADEYILAINPFNAEHLFNISNMDALYNQHKLLNNNTISNQISFRIGLNKTINFSKKNIAFVMADSEFNITWYPQEHSWDTNISNNKVKSLWSGTIIQSYNIGNLYNKKAIHLTKKQLLNEIIYQIIRSQSFQKLIFDNNNFNISKKNIIYSEIWFEWEYTNDNLIQKNKKWVNNTYNEQYRPTQLTKYKNLYLSGAHTKTSINIWSMEGAIESGKLAANCVLKKYNKQSCYLFEHTSPHYIKPFQNIDDLLYMLKLPNLIDTLIYIGIVILFAILYNIFLKRSN
jgi:hypothetical protein